MNGESMTPAATCRDCGTTDDVIDGLCEECESNYVYCTVCQKYIGEDYAGQHRHLFWVEGGHGWMGVGASDMTPKRFDDMKHALWRLLDAVPVIAQPLRLSISINQMGFENLHFSWSIFGVERIWCYLRDSSRPNDRLAGDYESLYCGDTIMRAVRDDDHNEDDITHTQYAVLWLMGLDNERTPEANTQTIAWIDEWLQRQEQSV